MKKRLKKLITSTTFSKACAYIRFIQILFYASFVLHQTIVVKNATLIKENLIDHVIRLLEAEPSVTQKRRRSTAQGKRRSKSTAQPQEAEEVPNDRWTSGLNMPIEGDSLSMKDLGMDLSIIDGYPEEQQTYGLSSQTNDWSGPDEDNNSRPPIADS